MTSSDGGFLHAALMFGSDDEFLAGALPFLRSGVEREEPVLVVLDEPRTDALREALGPASAAVGFADPADWFRSPGVVLNSYHHYFRQHHDAAGVRALASPAWADLAGAPGALGEWQRFEALLNLAFPDSLAQVVCPYDVTGLPEGVVEGALATHWALLQGDAVIENERYGDPLDYSRRLDERALVEPTATVAEIAFSGRADGARRFVRERCRQAGLSPRATEDFVLAVHEVVANAIRHGGDDGRLRAWEESGRLVCEVRDTGPGVADPLQGYLPPVGYGEGGWGLWLARQIAALVEVRSGPAGSVIRLHAQRGDG